MIVYFAVSLLSFYFARGGGGGHGGGGGGGHSGGFGGGGYYGGYGGSGGFSWWNLIIPGMVLSLYIYSAIHSSRAKRENPAGDVVVEWPGGMSEAEIARIFMAFQNDWSALDLVSMQTYTSPQYFRNLSLILTALKQMGRQNQMEDVRLLNCYPVNTQGSGSDVEGVIVLVSADARDALIDTVTNETLYVDTNQFSEYWYFSRIEGSWLLSDIRQATEAENVLSPVLQQFADSNGFLYSGEWGNLLMPTRGELFTGANFASSAINNHVIGMYKNTIIEFYTYLPDKNGLKSYTVAQAILPKSYGNIVVHHNKGILNLTPRGLTKVTLEWPDFNKKYSVFASDVEKATSLELLNPLYMVKLEALPFEVNIEVVDNVVYLHTTQVLEDYTVMMEMLFLAFKEMRM